jgi:hypothetical protein
MINSNFLIRYKIIINFHEFFWFLNNSFFNLPGRPVSGVKDNNLPVAKGLKTGS